MAVKFVEITTRLRYVRDTDITLEEDMWLRALEAVPEHVLKLHATYQLANAEVYISDFIPGCQTLAEYIGDKGPLKNDELRALFGQIVKITLRLKENHIFHRDIKMENILICSGHIYFIGMFNSLKIIF